jgi:phytoene/squalene synthetase
MTADAASLDGMLSPRPEAELPAADHTWMAARIAFSPETQAGSDGFFGFVLFLHRLAGRAAVERDDKLRFLDHIARAVEDSDKGFPLQEFPYRLDRLIATQPLLRRHAPPLLEATRREIAAAGSGRAEFLDWSEMHNWLRYAATPIGRFLLDLNKGSEGSAGSVDALCIAIGAAGRLQDASAAAQLGRTIVPHQWLTQAGADLRCFQPGGDRRRARNALALGAARIDQLTQQAADGLGRVADPGLRRGLRRAALLATRLAHRAARHAGEPQPIRAEALDEVRLRFVR